MSVIEFVCPFCHATIKAPEQLQGKAALCPKCREKCIVPDPDALPSAEPFSFRSTENEQLDFDPLPPPPGPEPWYFGFLVFYAYLQLILGIGGICFVIIYLLIIVGLMQRAASAWASASVMIGLIFVAFESLFFAAMILLAVDAARTLRAIRSKIRR
jgi:hypothetical protein